MFSCGKLPKHAASISLTTALLLLAISVIFLAYPLPASSDSPKKKLSVIIKKLKEEKEKIKTTLEKEASILSGLEKLDRSVKKKKGDLKYYNDRLAQTRAKIKILKNDISALNDKLGNRKHLLKKRLRVLYKQQYTGNSALILVSARNYQDLLRKSRYISLMAHYDGTLMNTYSNGIKKYHLKQMKMEALQKDLKENKDNIRTSMKGMQKERANKDKLLASVKDKRSTYEKMVRELKASSDKLKKIIKELEKKKIPPSVIGKGFRAMKGRLPWPVYGKLIVPFGKYKDPKFNIPVFKNGIEIKSKTGEAANAVHGGRVVYADWFKGYGQLLIINHGKGYHSLYGHLAEIFYKAGDIIKNGSHVGTIGEKGILNVPTLYFEIRHKGKPIDPLGWLKLKKKATAKAKKRVKRKIKKKRKRN